ncbi:MAG: sigma-54 dependent transcriptional regulator [Polyangiales bacterium]
MQKIRVLIADDDVEQARALGSGLVLQGYACELVRTAAAAYAAVVRGSCDLLVCDVRLGSSSDLELLDRVRTAERPVPVIILTTRGTTGGAVSAIKHGAVQYLVRPCEPAHVRLHIDAAVLGSETAERKLEARGRAGAGEMVLMSGAMTSLMQTVSRVALSSAPALIVGETGTGKELIARAIHDRGPRASRPFIAINTTAIPEQLLESELFGHVRGAYTGAMHARPGLFAEAEGGTILLDEIGDMPRFLQPKLLRALALGETRAVGSDRVRLSDVRIIAATHRDLSALVRENLFRSDLRYRLDTLTLAVPPLRARREDIAPLARHFLALARTRMPTSPVTSISDAAMMQLERASWPGNVRELESAIERVVVLTRDPIVRVSDLTFLLADAGSRDDHRWPQCEGRPCTMRELNGHYVEWMLEQTQGDKARAAELLGIDLSTLYRRKRAKGVMHDA